MRNRIKPLVIAGAFGLLAVSANAPADLLAQTDLPGVPVGITDPQRLPVKDEGEGTQAVQRQAQQRQQQQLEEIERMKAMVSDQNPGEAAQQQQTREIEPEDGDESEVQERLKQIQQQILAHRNNNESRAEAGTTIEVKPGVNRMVQVSQGHPNRVVVPFENPRIRTTSSDAEITAHGPVIYVATNSKRPVTLFVSPEDNERLAVSLTLIPKAIPPQELNITISGEHAGEFRFARPSAQKWEQRTPYVNTLIGLFESLAKQQLPRGYSIREPHAADPLTCWHQRDIIFELGQVVEGHNIEVQVLVAHNNDDEPVEVVGSMCAGDRVLAAAEWPRSVLEPNQKTEVYVARQRLDEAEERSTRPSLINHGE